MIKALLFGIAGEIIKDIAADAEIRKAITRGVKRAYQKRSDNYSVCPTCEGTGYTRITEEQRVAVAAAKAAERAQQTRTPEPSDSSEVREETTVSAV